MSRILLPAVALAAFAAAARAEPPAPEDLAFSWIPKEISGEAVPENTPARIVLGADGTAQGNGGCNGFTGTYRLEGESIAIGPLAATRRACLQPFMDLETRFFAALAAARAARIEDEGLVLLDGEGKPVARLAREVPG